MIVNNMSESARKYRYIVFRMVDGEAWYYGAWNDHERALEQALEIDGQFVPVEEVEEV